MSKFTVYVQGKPVEVSKEIYEYLTRSDNRINYLEKIRKRRRVTVDAKNESVIFTPSREVSLEQLSDLGQEPSAPNADFTELIVLKVTLEEAMSKLNDEERNLIVQLFYFDRTEKDLANELGISQGYLNKLKKKILCKLHDFLK